MRLQKLALLWMLEEKVGKRKKVASKKRKNRKIKKSHQGPEEVRKPRSSWSKALFAA